MKKNISNVQRMRKIKKIFKDARTYFMILLAIPTIWLIYQVVRYRILPTKYIVIALVLLALLWVAMVLMQYKSKKKPVRIVGKVLIVLLCAVLFVGNYTYMQTVGTLGNVSTTQDTDVVSVVVLKDSSYQYVEDLKGKVFSTLATEDEYVDKMVSTIKATNGETPDVKRYPGVLTWVNALYSGEVSCLIMNESYRAIIEEDYENFSDETRVIYTKNYVTEVNTTTNTDLTKNTFSVYISGIDTYGTISTKSRSDVNMIVTVNPTTKQILLTSIPRDYYVPFNVLGGKRDKLTHSGLYGVEETKTNVENYFGVDIDYYVRVNFTSLIDIVDAIGGINVDNPRAFGQFAQGNIHLNGTQALTFSRERHAFAEGDKERGRNQMRVITGIINKVISPSIITNYMSLLNSLHSTFQTNLTDDQMISLLRMQISDMSSWNIESISVDGNGASLYSPIYGSNLYMMVPIDSTVETAKQKINQLY
ncbi:LCP family protein [Thomasclavelia sp.]|uniref:LCP family glycopolymer transferase n=1 Tax=Thomasclavelia sp. TaxID=3025757 RepID=UPI0025E47689|nr:LCP family protein [Thomasclavelia sp.]